VKHPLQHSWTLWYDCPSRKVSHSNWHENLKKLITFDTVEDFWGVYNNILKPSQISAGSNFHLFKAGIEPMWEDKANGEGGKWNINAPKIKDVLDKMWLALVRFYHES
jgi:translation initiation factor 4E